jgi:squalene-hopene/tetraprenyl-beta-curcumene cyclase
MDRPGVPLSWAKDRDGRMTFTGSNAAIEPAASSQIELEPAGRAGLNRFERPPLGPSDAVLLASGPPTASPSRDPAMSRSPIDAALGMAGRTARWLRERQASDGHWRGPLEGDTILESEYILLLAWADRLDQPATAAAARRILTEQLPEGGWAIYPGGPVDISASVKAYLALKLTGHDPESPPLRKARLAIAQAGGPWAVNSFTKFYLALLGQLPYSACPAVPPEMVLLPDWFPINLNRVSAWSRTMIVPLSLMWAFKPCRDVPRSRGIAELFAESDPPQAARERGWARFFRQVDRLIKACESCGLTPLRPRAVQACRRWMLERFDGSDGLGAIFPPIVWSIIALRAIGCDEDAPEVRESWRQLERLLEWRPDGSVRIEPCRSPVWDTAITAIGLIEVAAVSGRLAAADADRLAATAGIDWLLDNEVRRTGDWARGLPAGDRVVASGWSFQYANRFYPDIDDTAMVLVALATWRKEAIRSGLTGPDDRSRLTRVEAAIDRGRAWLVAMQSSDGGWGAFDRDNDMELLCTVPFADHNAMIDPSTPDIAGRVLEALGKTGWQAGHPAVDRGLAYLRQTQESEGCWFGRWGVNYVYGTWQALEGLRAVGVDPRDQLVARAAGWLEDHQQPDGGWGESPESYADPGLAGVGPATASQTAWGLAGLVAAGRGRSSAAEQAVAWLESRQEADGSWQQEAFTGTGFPLVFYLRYHYYPIYFPLVALARTVAGRGEPSS